MTFLKQPNMDQLMEAALDITAPQAGAQVVVDKTAGVLWVNVDGVCVLRVCSVPTPIEVEYVGRRATATRASRREADRIDGMDRDDLGQSPDY